jgi:methionine-S-sulfoxide reductase
VELAFQRVPGVTRTEVGYSQGNLHDPTYEDVCTGATYHNEVVRVHYDVSACKFDDLLDVFWARHDPTTPNRQVSQPQINSIHKPNRMISFTVPCSMLNFGFFD